MLKSYTVSYGGGKGQIHELEMLNFQKITIPVLVVVHFYNLGFTYNPSNLFIIIIINKDW